MVEDRGDAGGVTASRSGPAPAGRATRPAGGPGGALREDAVRPADRHPRAETVLLGIAAAYFLAALPVLAVLRLRAPVEFNWLEGYHLAQVHHLLRGMPLYPAPALGYIPVIYGPLYAYLAAAVAALVGEGYAGARALSLAATLGTLAVVWLLVRRAGGSRLAAFIAAGLFAGMYGAVDFTFDAARVDSLFVLMTMVTVAGLWAAPSGGRALVAGTALAGAGAVLTKQTALVPVAALCVFGLVAGPARRRITAALCLVAVALGQAALAVASHGWSLYYLYRVPLAHPVSGALVRRFLGRELGMTLGAGLLLAGYAVWVTFKRRSGRRDALFLLVFFAAMAVAAAGPRVKIGGEANNLMPVAAALAVGGGLALARARARGELETAIVSAVLLLFCLQIAYVPGRALPSREGVAEASATRALLRQVQGPVFAPCHPYLAVLAGRNESAFWGAIADVLLTPGTERLHLEREMRAAFAERRFGAVVLRRRFFLQEMFPYRELEAGYRLEGAEDVAGMQRQEEPWLAVYLPRSDGSGRVYREGTEPARWQTRPLSGGWLGPFPSRSSGSPRARATPAWGDRTGRPPARSPCRIGATPRAAEPGDPAPHSRSRATR